MKQKGFTRIAVMVLVFVLLLILVLVTGYFYWQNKSAGKIGNTSIPRATFETSSGKINLFFDSPNYPVRQTSEKASPQDTFTGQRYILDGNPIRSFYIDYYPSVSDLRAKTNFTKDSDGDNAGQGCFMEDTKTTIDKVDFNKVICYYNPIGVTKSGKYISGTSSITSTDCVLFISPGAQGGLYFWGVAEVGHDTCKFISDRLSNFKMIYSDKSP